MPALWKAWKAKRQASHSFHEPLGNLAKSRRDSHIPTAPTTRADGKVENQKQVSHFPTAPISLSPNQNTSARRAIALRLASGAPRRPHRRHLAARGRTPEISRAAIPESPAASGFVV